MGFSCCDASETTATTVEDDPAAPTLDSMSPVLRCIYEFDITFSSCDIQSAEGELCDCSFDPYGASEPEDMLHYYTPPPTIRYHGLILPVRDEMEDFELSVYLELRPPDA